ncbi:rho GTPase-activating protein 25-like [Sinocyclocheilus rhinocerous]|uniref:rho GTPase-activating protein 25-like n=1 Tax=Sinocyclocheilus rhinocerous TaxID=307959 RepID=UPI0007B7F5E7|nr:PREDICTED: rho GTPase-activating protein 25-like [Sinocyclocheilus rhinocerous]
MDEQAGSAGNSPQHGRGSAKQIVLRCGWLRKQGGFVKTWHTRWFVLRGDQLYYYKDEDETKALMCTLRCLKSTSSFTRNYHDILRVQISSQDANKRGFVSSQILDFKGRQLLRSGFSLTKLSKDTEYDF